VSVTRAGAVAALVLAAAVLAVLVLRGTSHYTIHAEFQDAGQLVKGDRVSVGGITIGSVKSIGLGDRSQAVATLDITDKSFSPLHTGTTATIRSPSLSTQAGRYISLAPGPNSNPKIPDGATIGTDETAGIVDLDELLNTLDYQTRASLQGIVHGMATQFAGKGAADVNRALTVLNPALSQTQHLTGELTRDQNAFERFIVESAAVVSSIAPRDDNLGHGIASAAALTGKLAGQDAQISDLLRRAPGVLGQARGTLAHVDRALQASRPALRAARPVAPRLASVLRLLAPVARHARPAVADLNALLPDAQSALAGLPRLEQIGGPAIANTTSTVKDAGPEVAQVRPYVPDVISGLANGFGGSVGGYYDANGRYARIGFELPPQFLTQGGQLLGQPVSQLLNAGLGGGYKVQFPNFCPGGSTTPADNSAPFAPAEVKGHCNPQEKP
jgi:phospholipid/cholesterol/gamma-HCH transport system substrate-binding protein